MTSPDLERLGLYDALQLALSLSGKSVDDVAAEMGWGLSNANRIFSRENYWPTLPNLARLCTVLGNTVLLEWLHAQAEACGLRFDAEDVDATGLVLALGRLFKEMSDVAKEGAEAVKDGKIDQGEARRILRELRDVAVEVRRLTTSLRKIDPAEG